MPSHNERAFLELVEANRPRIFKICRVYAWTREDRDDLYQEILCQIWQSLPNLKDKTVASTWLYRVALNTAIGFVRKDRARRSRFAVDGEALVAALPADDSAGDAETGVQVAALLRAISGLGEMEKAVVTLFLEELSYAEIAGVTGLSESNVGVILHRAKKKLFNLVKEDSCTTIH